MHKQVVHELYKEGILSRLPEEILINIFSRLPAKSVGKCRCLAKGWQSLLSTPHFVKLHLARQNLYVNYLREKLILISSARSIHIANIDDLSASRKINLPPDVWIRIVGSCDGLVLLVNTDDEKFLLNPTTQQLVKIQDPHPQDSKLRKRRQYRGMKCSMELGLGYDSLSDDYKIVTLFYDRESVDTTYVDVYSVKSGVWKRVEKSTYGHCVPDREDDFYGDNPYGGAFANGAVHWLAGAGARVSEDGDSQYPWIICAFRLADEVFDEISVPSDVGCPLGLVVLEGSLCVVGVSHWGFGVWVMKEYGVEESWTKFTFDHIKTKFTFDMINWDTPVLPVPLCCIGDEEVVFLAKSEGLMVYEWTEGTLVVKFDDGYRNMFRNGVTFVESLISV